MVVVAVLLTPIHIPFASVFLTVNPLMVRVGVAVDVEPTLNAYVPLDDLIDALAFDADRVPSTVRVLPLPSAMAPLVVSSFSVPALCTVRPPVAVRVDEPGFSVPLSTLTAPPAVTLPARVNVAVPPVLA